MNQTADYGIALCGGDASGSAPTLDPLLTLAQANVVDGDTLAFGRIVANRVDASIVDSVVVVVDAKHATSVILIYINIVIVVFFVSSFCVL